MSAPDTNLTKQKKRHFPLLTGIAIAVLAVGAIVIGVSFISPTGDQAAPEVTTEGNAQ